MLPFMRKCGKLRYCRTGHRWMAIWRSRFACWVPKATNTHSKPLILIAVPQQQWLREGASVLRYTFSACLVPPQLRHRNVCSLLISVLVLCHEPSRRNCSHLAFVFDFVAIKILLQRWKHTNSPDVISHVSLFSDHCYVKHTEVGLHGLWYLALNSQM